MALQAVSQDAGDQLSQMVTPRKKRPALRVTRPPEAPAPAKATGPRQPLRLRQ